MAVFKPNPHPLLLLPGDIVESSARELEPEVNKNQEERSFQLLTTWNIINVFIPLNQYILDQIK